MIPVLLHDADPGALAPKAATLTRLHRAGLQVPAGVVVPLGPRGAPRRSVPIPGLAALLREGPVIVRSALALEDTEARSGAGLGISIAHCRTEAAVIDAVARIDAHRREPDMARLQPGDGATDQAIVQQQIERRWLLAVADHPEGTDVEVHGEGDDLLGLGATPQWAGSLAGWPDPAARAALTLVERARAALGPTRHGRELELVVDRDGRVHVVQARPLTAPVHPGAAAFLAEARARDPQLDLRGRLVLDAEHNPAPLSPAHAWLMAWLRRARPHAGDPTVLAGWLYVRVLPRALGRPGAEGPSASSVLTTLTEARIPEARRRLAEIEAATAGDDDVAISDAFDRALAAFLEMIDVYLRELVPARARARAKGLSPVADLEAPLSLSGRTGHLDVLPATWDVASASLAELGVAASGPPPANVGDERVAATLLGEWDDHLFALGLAPLRRVIRRAGARLGLDDDAFLLTPPELREGLVRPMSDLRARVEDRRTQLAHAASLRPPLCLEDGRPVAIAALGRLRGIGIGESLDGVIAPRRDLEDLLARPPTDGAVVTLPALTAPAAVALHHAGVRAVCCEHGGALSHATLMARELGLSAIVGCRGCTELAAGTRVRLDTVTGRLRVLAPHPPAGASR